MKILNFMHRGSTLAVLFVGALLLNIQPAHAVADLSLTVTDAGQPLGGATISLTFPDGSTQTARDDNNDGVIAMTLGSPGRYRMTITTADGRSDSTSFTAPSDGSVTVGYDASTGFARVSVNDTSARASSTNGPSSQFSGSILSSYGMSKWSTQIDNGGLIFDGNDGDLKKWGIGAELRYDFPNIPLFLSERFYYHPKGSFKDPIMVASNYDFNVRERWKNQMLLGWYAVDNNGFLFSLMAGITLAKIQLQVDTGSNVFEGSELQVAPTVGAGIEVPLNIPNMDNTYWMLGATFALMNGFSLEENDEVFAVDSNLQWDIYTGFRVRF